MTREEFLQRLDKALLAQVTEEERTEAIQFYEEYFSEAGPEQEEAVLAELGSPEKVAAIIKANVPGSRAEQEGCAVKGSFHSIRFIEWVDSVAAKITGRLYAYPIR